MSGIKPTLSLKQFILKQEVKNLYRQMFRVTKEMLDKDQRDDMRNWIRTDFRNNSHHTDEVTIKMYLQYGKKCLKELENSVRLAK